MTTKIGMEEAIKVDRNGSMKNRERLKRDTKFTKKHKRIYVGTKD